MGKYVLAFFTVAAVLAVLSCEPPDRNIAEYVLDHTTITVDEIGIDSLGLLGANMTVVARVNNRTDKSVDFDRVAYDVYYQGKAIGSGVYTEKWRLNANGYTVLEMPMTASYYDATTTFLSLGADDLATVKGVASGISVWGKHEYPFEVETHIVNRAQ
jgi:hypothetical protein